MIRFKPVPEEFVANVQFKFVELPASLMRIDGRYEVRFSHADVQDVKFVTTVGSMDHAGRLGPAAVSKDLLWRAATALWVNTDAAVEETFENAPISLNEHKAGKSWNAAMWSPRDALVDLLRKIDKGDMPGLDALFLGWRAKDDQGTTTNYSVASPDIHVTLGLMSRLSAMVNKSLNGD